MAKKISVIIVSYNVCQLLDECLQSVERALDGVESDIFVVDNRSTDNQTKSIIPYIHSQFYPLFQKRSPQNLKEYQQVVASIP